MTAVSWMDVSTCRILYLANWVFCVSLVCKILVTWNIPPFYVYISPLIQNITQFSLLKSILHLYHIYKYEYRCTVKALWPSTFISCDLESKNYFSVCYFIWYLLQTLPASHGLRLCLQSCLHLLTLSKLKGVLIFCTLNTQLNTLTDCATVELMFMNAASELSVFCWDRNGITHYTVIFVSRISQPVRDRIGRGGGVLPRLKCVLLNLLWLKSAETAHPSWPAKNLFRCSVSGESILETIFIF